MEEAKVEGYAVFCGNVSQDAARGMGMLMQLAIENQMAHIHLLIQSVGGSVGEGVFVYNFLRNSPIPLTVYNMGQVCSIAAIAYLGGEARAVSRTASFLLHKSHNSPQFATASQMEVIVDSLGRDDIRTETILRERTSIPKTVWDQLDRHDVYLNAEEAMEYGIATCILDFKIPKGNKLYTF